MKRLWATMDVFEEAFKLSADSHLETRTALQESGAQLQLMRQVIAVIVANQGGEMIVPVEAETMKLTPENKLQFQGDGAGNFRFVVTGIQKVIVTSEMPKGG